MTAQNAKDGKQQCKRPSIARQKTVFWNAKDGLLQNTVNQHVTSPVKKPCKIKKK